MEVIRTDSRVERAVRLLNENSTRTLADLASGCTLSVSRLSYLFKAKTGLTVGMFHRNRRFQAAMRMLATRTCRLNRSHLRLAIIIRLVSSEPLSFIREFHPASIASMKSERIAQPLLASSEGKRPLAPLG